MIPPLFQTLRSLLVLVLCVGIWAASDARANESAAMGALKVAKHYYDKGEFKKAAERFHEAYKIHPNPAFLFNAARAEQRGFLLEAAERDFNEVLAKSKNAEMQRRSRIHLAEIKAYRERLKSSKAEAAKAKADAEKARKEAEEARRRRKASGGKGAAKVASGVAGMSMKEKILYGVSGLLLVGSAVTYGAAANQRSQAVDMEQEIVNQPDPGQRNQLLADHAEIVESSASSRNGAVVMFGLGLGLGWFTYAFMGPDDPKKSEKDGKKTGKSAKKSALNLQVAPWFDGGGLTIRGAF